MGRFGDIFQWAAVVVALVVLALAWWPLERWRGLGLAVLGAVLLFGEAVLLWFHWNLYQLAVVVNPETSRVTGHLAVPPWIESERLYFWALAVVILGMIARTHRDELLPGIMTAGSLLTVAAMMTSQPFTNPLPSFLGQYGQYLQAMASGTTSFMTPAYQGMEAARQYYYNSWFMWVHPPLLYFGYACFTLSFVATMQMISKRHSAFETTAYHWARLGYLTLTLGMLLGFPWAILAWQGTSWWWSAVVNMALMMWLLYTGVLHARLYLRREGMWRWVAALSVASFLILLLTYVTTYVVPGAHSYADAGFLREAIASLVARLGGWS